MNEKIERRFTGPGEHVQVRAAEADGAKRISGYAAVFYDGTQNTEYPLWDDLVERISPGAFNAVLDADCRCLFNHESDKVLGRTKAKTCRLSADAVGLAYENDMPDSSWGNDVYEAVRRGDVSGSSFAFIPSKVLWSQEERDGKKIDVRTIMEVSALYDVGPVTYPAYEATTASVRSREELAAERDGQKSNDTVPDYETEKRVCELEIKKRISRCLK